MSQAAHIRCFQQAEGAEVLALASSRPGLLAEVADRFGVPRRYGSHIDVAGDPDIDIAAVIVPPEYNARICIDLLEAGKHVFCEKPVSLCTRDAQKMLDAATASDRHLMVGFMKRSDAGVQAAVSVVDRWRASGEAGELLFARMHAFIGGDWTANIEGLFSVSESDEPMTEKERSGEPEWLPPPLAGQWGEYYFFNHVHSHDMDLLAHLLGTEFTVAYVDWSGPAKLARLEFGGVPANLEVAKAGNNNRWDEDLTVYFEHGWVHIKLPPPMLINVPAQVEVYQMGQRQELSDVHARYGWSFLRQAQNTVDVVLGKAEPVCTIGDGLAQVRMSEEIFKAIHPG